MREKQPFSEEKRLRAGESLTRMSALLCALLMLVALPLLFHNAFFDINRFKVQAVCAVMPPLFALYALGCLLRRSARAGRREGWAVTLSLGLLLLSCVVSCARTGFAESTLTGSDGRYCGLIFVLCCGAAYAVIAYGLEDTRLLTALMMTASALCAALGLLNAMGIDPLGFYARIKRGQELVFLSTIGNTDFFGTYLVLLLPVSAAQAVFSPRVGVRACGAACAAAIMLGAFSARTDCALAGVHLVCFVLLALSGASWDAMARALGLWAMAFVCQPVVRVLLSFSPYKPKFSGLPRLLSDKRLALVLAGLWAGTAIVCLLLKKRGKRVPGCKRLAIIGVSLLLAAVLAFAGTMAYYTLMDTQTKLNDAASVFRFNDRWGSSRGYVYTRSMRAYADYSPGDKLFGRGMEQTLLILKPYCEKTAGGPNEIFNDPHCQPLQFLLTCGAFGAAAFVALYAASLITIARRMRGDVQLIALFASLAAYALVALLNVTQPILIATYLSLCALAVAHIRLTCGRGKEDAP